MQCMAHTMLSISLVIIISIVSQVSPQVYYGLIVNNKPIPMYSPSGINSSFIYPQTIFDCSDHLYSFYQTAAQYHSNQAYRLEIKDNSNAISLQITTQFGSFSPTLSSHTCNQRQCSIQINKNCPARLSNGNYFDILHLTITPIGTFSYSVDCNIQFNQTQLQWGMLIIITISTIILSLSTLFSRFNSFDGGGLTFNIWWILVVSLSVLLIGLMSIFLPGITTTIMDVVSWISTIACVSIALIEILYSSLKTDFMRQRFCLSRLSIRMVDIIGVLLSIPVALAWWLTNKNWIVSDFISICIVVSIIKVFKLISFKMALIAYVVMLVLYSAGYVVVALVFKESFNSSMLFQVNNPYEFQIPLITPMFNTKCAWISITTISFPGLFVSFLYRFDKSRNTHIYYISAIVSYFSGSVLWWVVNTLSYYPLPFDAFCEPVMMISLSLFAFKRKELRTLWEGKFYDEEYLNKKQIEEIGTKTLAERPEIDIFKGETIKDLFLSINEDSELKSESVQGSKEHTINNDML